MKLVILRDDKKYRFNIVNTEVGCDTTEIKKLQLAIKTLHAKVKKLKKDSPEHALLSNNIRDFKNQLKEYVIKVYKLEARLGDKVNWEIYTSPPTKENVSALAYGLIDKLKVKRANNKLTKPLVQNFNGFRYETIGGTFTAPNSILKLMETDGWRRIQMEKTPHPKVNAKYLGIELEFICKIDAKKLNEQFIKAGLAGCVHVVHDGSITKETLEEYPHEVTVLVKENNLVEIINKVCAVLRSGAVEAYVNNSCGMHVHFDVRKRNPDLVYKNLVRMLPLLTKMIPSNRVGTEWANEFCMYNTSDDINVGQQTRTAHQTGKARYQAINPMYDKHNTIEVRLHSGTINANKIINWIKVCLLGVDSTAVIPFVQTVIDLCKVFKIDDKFKKYINDRIEFLSKKRQAIDTRSDHFFGADEVA